MVKFFKGTAAERAASTKTGEAGDLVIESDTGNIAVANGSALFSALKRLARTDEVTAAQTAATIAAATDATTKANAAQTAAATDASTKATAARAGALTDVHDDIAGGTGPVATVLSASTADAIAGSPGSGLTPQQAVDKRATARAIAMSIALGG